jgi:hypothetical protein
MPSNPPYVDASGSSGAVLMPGENRPAPPHCAQAPRPAPVTLGAAGARTGLVDSEQHERLDQERTSSAKP